MTSPYRLYGAELSPYSTKVRSYLRFKNIPFEWLPRNQARQDEFARYAKLPLIPLLVDADEKVLQDSTPIIEALDLEFPDPTIIPSDPSLAFLAVLLEDYADEWLNKAMFHYRWTYPDDQASAAKRIVQHLFDGGAAPPGLEDSVRTRMSGRLHHVGSSAETLPIIEGSFVRLVPLLERLLNAKRYLFGGRPCLADFGIAAQLGQLLSDPTPGALLREQAPAVVRWVERMDAPQAEGDFLQLEDVRDDLGDLLRTEVAGVYLPWMLANSDAVADDASILRVEIDGRIFVQKPQRYAAKAFAELKRKRGLVAGETALAVLLGETGCDAYLAAADADESADESEPAAETESADV